MELILVCWYLWYLALVVQWTNGKWRAICTIPSTLTLIKGTNSPRRVAGAFYSLFLIIGQHFTCYRAVATRHHWISVIPRIQIAVNQFPFLSKIQQALCVSHIVILLPYHLAHVKTEYKGAATPSPFSPHTASPPPCLCIIHLHYGGCTQTFLFLCTRDQHYVPYTLLLIS